MIWMLVSTSPILLCVLFGFDFFGPPPPPLSNVMLAWPALPDLAWICLDLID